MKWMLVYWIFLVSFIISEIHSHKYGLITYTLPLISPHHPFKTIHNDLSLNIHIYLKLIENLKLIQKRIVLTLFLLYFFFYIFRFWRYIFRFYWLQPSQKESQNCVQMWSCDLQRLPQLNFQKIERRIIVVFLFSDVNIFKNKYSGLFSYCQDYMLCKFTFHVSDSWPNAFLMLLKGGTQGHMD